MTTYTIICIPLRDSSSVASNKSLEEEWICIQTLDRKKIKVFNGFYVLKYSFTFYFYKTVCSMTSQENGGETRQYKGRSINARVITFIQEKSLVNTFHILTEITFKSFLVNNYSLDHEGRKTIHALDFHRWLTWTSLNTNVLFVLT